MTNVSRNFERCRFRYPNVFWWWQKNWKFSARNMTGTSQMKTDTRKKNCSVKHWNKLKFIVTHVFMPMIILARNKRRKKVYAIKRSRMNAYGITITIDLMTQVLWHTLNRHNVCCLSHSDSALCPTRNSVPRLLQRIIIKSQAKQNPPTSLFRYTYNSQFVYTTNLSDYVIQMRFCQIP